MLIATSLALSGAESPVCIPRSLGTASSSPLCSTEVNLQVCLSHQKNTLPLWAFSGEEMIEVLLAASCE